MRYSTITIRPKAFNEPGWNVHYEDLPHERANIHSTPSDLGFYHYPTQMGREKAFEALRNCMIKRHQDEIDALVKSMESLKTLSFCPTTRNREEANISACNGWISVTDRIPPNDELVLCWTGQQYDLDSAFAGFFPEDYTHWMPLPCPPSSPPSSNT